MACVSWTALVLITLVAQCNASPVGIPASAATAADPSIVARAALETLMIATSAKNIPVMNATFAPNITVYQGDVLCSGPAHGADGAYGILQGNFQFYRLQMRPLASIVAFKGTPSDPTGGIQFAASFTDIGIFPKSALNVTRKEFPQPDTWGYLDQAMVVGELDRNNLFAKLDFYMNFAAKGNKELQEQGKQYFVQMTNGTLSSTLSLFTDDAVFTGRGKEYLGGGDEYNLAWNKTGYAALMKDTFTYRTEGKFLLGAQPAGCGRAAVFNTVQNERYASSNPKDGKKEFMAFGSHVFYFEAGTNLINKVEWLQLEARHTSP